MTTKSKKVPIKKITEKERLELHYNGPEANRELPSTPERLSGEIGERAGQAIDLIDHHDGDLAGPDIGQEVLQGRAVERGA
jgi:hypothetical protein